MNIRHATCRHLDFRVRCASRCLTRQHTTSPHRARKDALATDRRHLQIQCCTGAVGPAVQQQNHRVAGVVPPLQSDLELKKYLWVVIRTQKDKKLQTLIEVCTDFASLGHATNVHRPAEQVFALEEDDDREEEMFAVVDRQQWNTQRAAEPPLSPELQQMFALARHMGYEMRPIARRFDAPRQTPGPRSSPNKEYRAPFRPRDYSRTKCFSCGQLGHTQVRCPNPDSSLPFRPSGWIDRSDGPQRRNGGPPQANEI